MKTRRNHEVVKQQRLLDAFTRPFEHTETILNLLPMGKLKMPPSSAAGDVHYRDKRLDMRFTLEAGRRF